MNKVESTPLGKRNKEEQIRTALRLKRDARLDEMKRTWKGRYDGDVSTPPRLIHCLSSSNSVDKLKVIKKTFTNSV